MDKKKHHCNKNNKDKNNNENKTECNIKEIKLKPIRPTLREKKRFIKIKVNTKFDFDFKRISKSLNDELLYYLGAIDFGASGIWILKDKFDYENQELIIRVSNEFTKKTIASFNLISRLDSVDVKIDVLKVSGTLKGLNNK